MNNTVNKDQLVKLVSEKLDRSPKEIKQNVEEIFSAIALELAKGDTVQIVGFGKFSVRKRKARVGRDPNTGKKLALPETDTPAFSASRNLSDLVKGRG